MPRKVNSGKDRVFVKRNKGNIRESEMWLLRVGKSDCFEFTDLRDEIFKDLRPDFMSESKERITGVAFPPKPLSLWAVEGRVRDGP